MSKFNIAGICGSLREASLNRMALRLASESVPSGTRFSELGIGDVPMFDGDLMDRGIPPSVVELRAAIRMCDGVVIATPEYNFSIPGVLKNALDWVSRGDDQPFSYKPVAIITASPGPLGGARVQYDLRKVLLYMNAQLLAKPEVFIGGAAGKFDANGECVDETTRGFVKGQMTAFVRWIEAVKRMGLGAER